MTRPQHAAETRVPRSSATLPCRPHATREEPCVEKSSWALLLAPRRIFTAPAYGRGPKPRGRQNPSLGKRQRFAPQPSPACLGSHRAPFFGMLCAGSRLLQAPHSVLPGVASPCWVLIPKRDPGGWASLPRCSPCRGTGMQCPSYHRHPGPSPGRCDEGCDIFLSPSPSPPRGGRPPPASPGHVRRGPVQAHSHTSVQMAPRCSGGAAAGLRMSSPTCLLVYFWGLVR